MQILQQPQQGDQIRIDSDSSPGVVYEVADVLMDPHGSLQITLLSPTARKIRANRK